MVGSGTGGIRVDINDVQVRNLQTVLPSSNQRRWQNNLATLDGQVALEGGWLHGENLAMTTDFASADLDGSFPTSISFVGTDDNPLLWMRSLHGSAKLNVDLAALAEALPGLLPIREDATLVSGTATAIIKNESGTNAATRRSELTLKTRSLRARSGGRLVVIEPISIDATVSDRDGALHAEQFSLKSSFAQASGSGRLSRGETNFNIDFGRLYSMLRPVIDLSELSLGGSADGRLRWSVDSTGAGDQWELSGIGEANQLLVTLPGGHRFKRSIVQADVNAKGQWKDNELQRLSSANVAIASGGVLLKALLLQPVDRPTADSVFPVRLETDGRLENLSESLGPWLPDELVGAEGRLSGNVVGNLSRFGGTVSSAEFEVLQPRISYGDRWYSQPKLTLDFDGVLELPAGSFSTPSTSIVGESISLAIRGDMMPKKTNLDIAWKADLEGLQDSVGSTIARAASMPKIQPIGFRPIENESYRIAGRCEGEINVSDTSSVWNIKSELSGEDLRIYKNSASIVPPGTSAGAFQVKPKLRGRYAGSGLGAAELGRGVGEVIWSEPRLKINGPLSYSAETGRVELGAQQVACDWFAGSLSGFVESTSAGGTAIALSGPSRTKLDVLALRLSSYLGSIIRAEGIHESEIALTVNVPVKGDLTFDLQTDIGWNACEVAGVRLGQSKLPLRVTTDQVRIDRATIPVLEIGPETSSVASQSNTAITQDFAKATLGATVDLNDPDMPIRLDRGSSIQSLRITPQAAENWLKYLAPLAAGATRIDGVVSAVFDEAILRTDDPTASTIRGNLEIGSMTLSSGPLANQLVQGVRQIKSMTRLTGGRVEAVAPTTLIEMPPQSVPFVLADKTVAHQRMYFTVDRAEMMTSGSVGVDTSLSIVAQVQLDQRWLGSDLKGLAGQNLAFPITGTISRPRLDETALRRVMAELVPKAGAEVLQNRLDGLIQKQFGDQINQLNSGLEKVFGF